MRIHFFVRTIHELGAGAHQNSISFIRYLSSTGNDVRVHTFTSHNNKPPHDITIIDHSCNNLTFLEEQEKLIQILKENENAADVYFLYGVDFTWVGESTE